MAITFDASTNGFANTTTSPQTWSHTVASDANCIIVGLVTIGGVTVSSVTYAGTAMTAGYSGSSGLFGFKWYYLISPTTGTNNCVATFSGSLTWFISGVSISLKGVHTTDPTDGGSGNVTSTTNTSITNNITTTADGCWVLSLQEEALSRMSCGWTAGAGETLRGCNGAGCAMSSKPDKTPSGSVTMTESTPSSNNKSLSLTSWRPASFSTTSIKDIIMTNSLIVRPR